MKVRIQLDKYNPRKAQAEQSAFIEEPSSKTGSITSSDSPELDLFRNTQFQTEPKVKDNQDKPAPLNKKLRLAIQEIYLELTDVIRDFHRSLDLKSKYQFLKTNALEAAKDFFNLYLNIAKKINKGEEAFSVLYDQANAMYSTYLELASSKSRKGIVNLMSHLLALNCVIKNSQFEASEAVALDLAQRIASTSAKVGYKIANAIQDRVDLLLRLYESYPDSAPERAQLIADIASKNPDLHKRLLASIGS